MIGADRTIGIVVGPDFAAEAGAAATTLEADGFSVETAVVDGTDLVATSTMLTLLGNGVESVVLGTDAGQQDRWFAVASTLRMPFDHVVADVGDSIAAETYTAAPRGLRAVAATRLVWFARDHGETEAQRGCRDRFDTVSDTEEELGDIYLWCQHVQLAQAVLDAGLDLAAGLAPAIDSPVTSPLVAATPTGYGPRDVAVLGWEPTCSCWVEATAYTARRGTT